MLSRLGLGIQVIVLCLIAGISCSQEEAVPMTNGQGEMAGEVTSHSVVLQSRVTGTPEAEGAVLPGQDGMARFEVAASSSFEEPLITGWLLATAEGDHVVKTRVEGLEAGTRYYYRLVYGPDQNRTTNGPVRSFKTLHGADAAAEVNFVVVTGMNYFQFHDNPVRAYKGPDKALGYPALVTILEMKPDFFIGTGDNVYYDHPHEGRAETATEMRAKWHMQFQQPRYIDLWAEVPSYWEKDDHDYRYNDCDNTSDFEPSPELGASIFLEQLPIADPNETRPITYRTHRVSKDLQIWLTEGREYRSPHMMPSGPEKTLWGVEQREWLKRTLLESDAAFKILMSAGPLIGPDDANQAGKVYGDHDEIKRDNHSDPEGFQYERDEFFGWLLENDFLDKHFYIVCGDRHWQYHSIHPTGFEEFSTGALVDANSRLGRDPGDPESTDPEALIKQPFTSKEPSGGFLRITITPGPQPKAVFGFHNEEGELLYKVEKTEQS